MKNVLPNGRPWTARVLGTLTVMLAAALPLRPALGETLRSLAETSGEAR